MDISVGERSGLEQLAKASRLLYKKGFVEGSEGNCSLRVGDMVFIKVTEAVSRTIRVTDFVGVDLATGNIQGQVKSKPSIELHLHLETYRRRDDVKAIIHSHPRCTRVVSKFVDSLPMFEHSRGIPEVKVVEGEAGSPELAKAAASEFQRGAVAVILRGHGLVTVGKTLGEAFDLIGSVERAASEWLEFLLVGGLSTPLGKRQQPLVTHVPRSKAAAKPRRMGLRRQR